MPASQRTRAIDGLKKCSAEIILRCADLCDGHSILTPTPFIAAGLPDAVVDYLTRTYRSDGTPKGTIFSDGTPVARLSGIYGLDLLRFLAAALEVEYPSALGRGFEARNIQAALRKHFGTGTGDCETA